MAGTPLKNLRMFEQLCGKNAFHNVILTTTMWDEVEEKTGEDRERELKTHYWRTMLERNSTTSRFLRTRESAFNLIDPLIEAANRKFSVLLQGELVDMRKSLPATAAGQELFSAMGKLVSQREDLLRRIRQEMKRSDGDKMILEPLQEEHQKLQISLEATVNEMRKLSLPLGKRLLIMTDKFFSSKFESLKSLISKRLSKPDPNTPPTGKLSPSPIDSYAEVFRTPAGTVSDDQTDCIRQSPGSISETPLPIANGSNVLGQGPTNGTDESNNELHTLPIGSSESALAPVSLADHHPAISKDQPPGSTSDTSLSITSGSNVLGQGPTSGTDRSNNELPTLPIGSSELAPVSHADHHPTISKDQPPGSTSDTSLSTASGSNVLGQGPTSGTDRSNDSSLSTTKETQDNPAASVEFKFELPTSPIGSCQCELAPVSHADHHQDQSPGSTFDTLLPIANGSNVLRRGPKSGTDGSNNELPTLPIGSSALAPVSLADHHPIISKDQPPGSTSDTSRSIASGSNVLGQRPTSGTDRSNKELPTLPIGPSALAPVSLADHHPTISKDQPPGSTFDTSLSIASGSNVLGQGPTSGTDRSNRLSLSATKETQDNTMSSNISTLGNQLSQFVYSWTRNQRI